MRATIAIPTLNARPWITGLLQACLDQRVDFDHEVLVIDSGSIDGTVEAVREHPTVRLHQISQSEFGHGRTRNLAVQLARGELIAFLTQDALPATDRWLEELLRPFDISRRVAAVLGKQIPRADCCPTVKRDVASLFRSFGPDQAIMVQGRNGNITDPALVDAIAFLSDVNSAFRKSALLQVPFRDLPYAEDQALGRDLVAAGLYKAYAPLGAVIHSHSYPLTRYFRRMHEEMTGLRNATGQSLDTSVRQHLEIAARDTVKDWIFVLRDRAYSRRAKAKWLVQVPFYNLVRRLAIRVSTRQEPPRWAARLLGAPRSG